MKSNNSKALYIALCCLTSSKVLADNAASLNEDIQISNKAGLMLESNDFYFRINGRLMVDYSIWQGNAYTGSFDQTVGAGSEVRRSRIYLKGKYKDWQYRFQTNINSSGAANSNTYISYTGFKKFNIYIGKHAEPFGFESSNSSKYISAIERTVTGNSHFAGDREMGISIAAKTEQLSYQIGLFDIASTETDVNYAVTGRVAYNPINTQDQIVHMGIGLSARELDENEHFQTADRAGVHPTSIKSITTESFSAKNSQVANAELYYQMGNWNFTSEYLISDFEGIDKANDRNFSSYYFQGSYFITNDYRPYELASGTLLAVDPNSQHGAWEIFYRYEAVNFKDQGLGTKATIRTAGINYFATKYSRLSLNVTDTSGSSTKISNETLALDGSAITFRAQFYW